MPRRLLRSSVFALLLCLATATLGGGDDAAERLATILEQGRAAATRLRDSIDAADFDVDALAKKLGPDPEAAFWHVRAVIGYDPYPGALRGAQGCLRAGAGNSVDRSLLLAALLQRNGHRVRFAFGELTAETAESWVDVHIVGAEGPSPLTFELPYFIDDESITAGREQKDKALCSLVEGRFGRLREAVAGALGERAAGGKGARPGVAISQLVKEARDHVWVQVERDGSWVDLDPSPEGPEPGSRIVEPRTTADAVAAESWHQVRFRGFAERFDGRRVSEEDVFDVSLPAADLSGRLVVVETLPAEGAGGVAAPTEAGESRRLRLRVDDKETVAGVVEVSRPAGGLDAGGLGGLVGGNKKERSGDVVALGVEVCSSLGTRRGEPARRYLLDRWGHAARMRKDVAPLGNADDAGAALAQADATVLALAVETGSVHPAHLQWQVLDHTIQTIDSLKVDGERLVWTGRQGDLAALLLARTYYHIVDRATAGLLPRMGYAAEPRIVLLRLGTTDGKASLSIDVTQDHDRIPAVEGEETYRAEWERGLLSAIAEESIVSPPKGATAGERTTRGCAQAFEDSLALGPTKLIEKADGLPAVSPDADAWIAAALRKGRLVLLPGGQPAEARAGWLELDPRSGELVAWIETGLHEGTTERVILEKDTPQKTAVANEYRSVVHDRFGCVAESVAALGSLALTTFEGGAPIMDTIDLAQALVECITKVEGPFSKSKKVPPEKIRIDRKTRDHVKKRHQDPEPHPQKTKWDSDKDWEDYTKKTLAEPDRVFRGPNGNWVYEKDFGGRVGGKLDGSGVSNKVQTIVKANQGGNGGRVVTSYPVPNFSK